MEPGDQSLLAHRKGKGSYFEGDKNLPVGSEQNRDLNNILREPL